MKIVYMGTPDFAVAPLEALIAAGHTITCVVTQPDKAKGRSGKLVMTPVKECAVSHSIPVFQPVKIKTPEAVAELKKYEADVYVVAAFGQILSREILDMPPYGCINIHASLLPAYRGAAPIEWAILNGEKQTGVTIMQMDPGIDTGDMYLKTVVPITEEDNSLSLEEKLTKAGAGLIVEALEKLEAGELTGEAQKDADSCYAKMLNKEMGLVDWTQDAAAIARRVRGLYAWPGAYTYYKGKLLKLWRAVPGEKEADGEPGTVSAVTKKEISVNTGKGQLVLKEVQLEGKKRMEVQSFLLGCKVEKEDKLG